MLWESHQLVYRMFDFYAAASYGSGDIFNIDLPSYQLLVEQCHLAIAGPGSPCNKGRLDQIFILVNADPDGTNDEYNHKRALNRYEFLQVLVRVAVARFINTGKTADVSEALQRLFNADLDPHIDPVALQDSNVFRRAYCYTEGVDGALRAHEKSLRALFEAYAAQETAAAQQRLARRSMLSYEEWCARARAPLSRT